MPIDAIDLHQRNLLSVIKEIRLFHLRKLLTSLDVCQDRTEK